MSSQPTADAGAPDVRGHLVGRDVERAQIEGLWPRITDKGAALVLRGEPGVGLTALVDEASAEATKRAVTVLAGRGVRAETGLTYAGLHQLQLGMRDRPDLFTSAAGRTLTAELGSPTDLPASRFAVSNALLEILTEFARATPVAIVIDDAHFLDPATSEALTFVGRRIESVRVALLLSVHDDAATELSTTGLPELVVDRLDARSAEELLTQRAPDLTGAWRDRILVEAEGLPLALTELASSLATDTTLLSDIPPPLLPLTPRLQQTLLAHADYEPPTRQVLLAAALEPDAALACHLHVASSLTGSTVTVADLSEAVSDGVVTIAGEHARYTRRIVRSAMAGSAKLSEVRAAHAALAAALGDDHERCAWHRAASVVGPDATLADLLEESARNAYRHANPTLAAMAFERAAELSGTDDDRGRRLTHAAALAFELGLPACARRLLNLTDQLDLSELERTRAAWQSCIVDATVFSPERSVGSFIDMAAMVGQQGDAEFVRKALVPVGLKCWWSTSSAATRESLALTAKLFTEDDDDPARLAVLGLAAGDDAGPEVLEHLNRLRPHDMADPLEAVHVAMAAAGVGAWRAATVFLGPAISDLREQGRMGTLTRALAYSAWAALHTGDWPSATADAEDAAQLAVPTGQPHYVVLGELIAMQVAALRGAEADLEGRIARTEGLLLRLQAKSMLAPARLARGAAALSDGRHEVAYEHVRPIFDRSEMPFHASVRTWAILDLVEAGVHSGNADAVSEVAEGLTPLAQKLPGTLLHAALTCSQPLLAADEDAEELFQAALSARLGGWPFLRARTLLSKGAWLRRQRRVADSRRPLREARDLFNMLGAVRWTQRAAAELRATGESTGPRADFDRDRLTAQEEEIARLAADGMTNREIGERLYLSHRTVGSHLYRIFPKLGISARSELRQALDSLPEE